MSKQVLRTDLTPVVTITHSYVTEDAKDCHWPIAYTTIDIKNRKHHNSHTHMWVGNIVITICNNVTQYF